MTYKPSQTTHYRVVIDYPNPAMSKKTHKIEL